MVEGATEQQEALPATMQRNDGTESTTGSLGDAAIPTIHSVNREEEESYDECTDERTIDAAAVVEIHEDEVEAEAPVLFSPQTGGPVRVFEQNTGIPEVEPEVDIEEVDFEDRNDGRSISALTMSLAITASRDEDDGGKPASSLPPFSLPVSMPEQLELAATKRNKSNGSGSNGRRSNGSGSALPDYKAQVNSRSFIGAVMAAEVRPYEVEDSFHAVSAAEMADFHQDGGCCRTAAATGKATGDQRRIASSAVATFETNLVYSENQTRNASPPNGIPFSIRQVSNKSGGVTNYHDDQEHIPVASAVLVPPSILRAEEESQEDDHQRNHESGTSTLTTDESSSSNNNGDKVGTDNPRPPVASERRFWLTIIFAAFFLNSLLVAGAVVGGFCAAGKCSSSSSSSTEGQGGQIVVTSLSPSSAPTPHERVLSEKPTNINRPKIAASKPTVLPQPSPVPVPSVSLRPSPPPLAFSTSVVMPTSANNSGQVQMPTSTLIATLPPILAVQDRAGKVNEANKNGKSGVPWSILLPIVAGFEVLIVAGLVMYYRRWKHRRELCTAAPSDITVQASLNEETIS